MDFKVTKEDGFVWRIIPQDMAVLLVRFNYEVYLLYDDDSESLAESVDDVMRHGGQFGLEVGFLKDMK